ncbi:hypothetical protein [Aliarcobacter cryaerophilus]|uniref:hypothetical protein n=1 Tax=Aliarcobacter cryaerophilus TaxID=28198 RepID=UPI0021B2B685|nr:hypothetical protein [Aliarcobacter cryaerophilus]MCT7444110.1 hypothetical protein [Aliarcobacter cryaerophilus]MCT7478402.1 hypothetical protein [Aliarcobacter cryaerophilus]
MCQNNFCISTDSFKYFGNELQDIYKNISRFYILCKKINDFDDQICHDVNLYTINLTNEFSVSDILYTNTSFDQDNRNLLIELLKTKTYAGQEINGFIGLNKINIDIICEISELINFYNLYMSNIKDENIFSCAIKKYFKNLVFQDNIVDSIRTLKGGGLEYFSNDIIKSLIYLNDEFKQILIEENYDVRKSLIKLSSAIGFKTTIEGDADRKADFTFEFKKDDGSNINICCEPHIKLSKSSKEGDNTHYHNRLHFHAGNDYIKNKNILIGSIGCHL